MVVEATVGQPDLRFRLVEEGEAQLHAHEQLLLLDDGRHDILVEQRLALRVALVGEDSL